MNMAAQPLVGLFAAVITTALLAPSVEAQQNACPPEVAQAQAALKGRAGFAPGKANHPFAYGCPHAGGQRAADSGGQRACTPPVVTPGGFVRMWERQIRVRLALA
jgi:hypothetical protein